MMLLKRQLSTNYYSCLSPPTCQVEEQDNPPTSKQATEPFNTN